MTKNNFGHQSEKPCAVCNKHKNNQIEPRFGYVVCEDHQDVKPIEITGELR
jgi:hypothetical protein